nr:NADP-dependent isocitrate dehydrogenase [Calditrichia bacterium]
MAKITWTHTDEAPALASKAFLPVLKAFTKETGIEIDLADISLSGRILANFPEKLTEAQKIPDYLTLLGEMTQAPDAIIVKLPNISASIPQLQSAIKELREKGYDIPEYPEDPKTPEEKALQ